MCLPYLFAVAKCNSSSLAIDYFFKHEPATELRCTNANEAASARMAGNFGAFKFELGGHVEFDVYLQNKNVIKETVFRRIIKSR